MGADNQRLREENRKLVSDYSKLKHKFFFAILFSFLFGFSFAYLLNHAASLPF